MRIVFTGISGTDIHYIVRRFADYIQKNHGESVFVMEAEEELRKSESDYYEYLDSIPTDKAARQWSDSIKEALRSWQEHRRRDQEPKFSFLSLHLTYHVHSQFYTPLTWTYVTEKKQYISQELIGILRDFQPQLFINFIDNVFSVQKRITSYPFRLVELMRWRNIEMLMTDLVAGLVITECDRRREKVSRPHRYAFERSPVVAVRHPMEMLYHLIADENRYRIYMAYPITEPREVKRLTGSDHLMNQVNAFRAYMREQFVAFDPVTIDERPIKFLWNVEKTTHLKKIESAADTVEELRSDLRGFLEGDQSFQLSEETLWPASEIEHEQMLCGPIERIRTRHGSPTTEEGKLSPWSILLPKGEVQLVSEEKKFWAGSQKGGEIDNQIEQRDYRLIDQVDCVVIYRPSMNKPGGWELGGTWSEYQHAKKVEKPALVIRDKIDGPLEKPPFVKANPFDVILWENLDTDPNAQRACFAHVAAKINERVAKSLATN